jgi:hypothetical protein
LRVPVVTVVLILTPVLAASQSLGDAARQQARKRTTAAPAPATARVYSDADLHSEADGPDAVPADGGEAAQAAAGASPPRAAVAEDPVRAGAARASGAVDPVRAELDREAARREQRER